MAAPFFEKSTGIVVIEWYESREKSSTPTKHHFEAKPIKLQLYPKDPSRVIRIYFEGKMPAWLNRYAKVKTHPFECKEIFQNGMVGWWIANWSRFDVGKPLNAPTIKGCINSFICLIPSVVEDYRERVLAGLETIAANLAIDPTFYEPFGLYYRSEEITGDGGAMVVDEDLFPVRMSDESDQDFESRIRSHGRLDRLIFELTTPLPVSTIIVDEEGDGPSEIEEEFELAAFEEEEEFALEFEEEDEFTLIQEDDTLFGQSQDFVEEDADSLQANEEESAEIGTNESEAKPHAVSVEAAEQSQQPAPPAEEEEAVLDGEGPAEHIPESEIESKESELAAGPTGDPESEADGVADQEESEDLLQLHIVDNSNRKHSALSGQLSFF